MMLQSSQLLRKFQKKTYQIDDFFNAETIEMALNVKLSHYLMIMVSFLVLITR